MLNYCYDILKYYLNNSVIKYFCSHDYHQIKNIYLCPEILIL